MTRHATARHPPTPEASISSSGRIRAAPAVMAAILVAAVVWTAWVCDDAFITARTVDNLVAGRGLRWNVSERVQVFTHPLWALLQAPIHALTRDGWSTLMILSLGTSVATVLVLLGRHDERPGSLAVAFAALASSKAFVEYSTSGLENPLTHLLLAVALAAWLQPPGLTRRLPWIALCTGLALLNRLDTAVLFGPLLLAAGIQERRLPSRRLLAAVVLAALPIAVWEAFSLFYYGYPFPNTAYAKLGTGLPAVAFVRQGLLYLASLLAWDLPSFLLLAGGLPAAMVLDRRRWAVPTLGVALYLVYVTRIGGDFMVGRFFSAPILVAAIALAHVPRRLPRPAWIAPGVLVVLTFLGPTAPLRTGPGFHHGILAEGHEEGITFAVSSGIADERGFDFQGTSLVGRPFRPFAVVHRFAADGRAAAIEGRSPVVY